jgi:hypothetical protein
LIKAHSRSLRSNRAMSTPKSPKGSESLFVS